MMVRGTARKPTAPVFRGVSEYLGGQRRGSIGFRKLEGNFLFYYVGTKPSLPSCICSNIRNAACPASKPSCCQSNRVSGIVRKGDGAYPIGGDKMPCSVYAKV